MLIKLLKTNKSTSIARDALLIANRVRDIIKPKFILKKANIDKVNSDGVVINYNKFKSKILANKLKNQSNVFAFIITGGKEIALYMNSVSDFFENYILDQIAYMGYLSALNSMQETLENNFNVKKYITLAPGSLADWDVGEVLKIFKLIGNDYTKIGVKVLDSGMVDPIKSTSGILFESDDSFYSCEICMRINCPNRESEFCEEKYTEMINL